MKSKPIMRFVSMLLVIMISLTTSLPAFAVEQPVEGNEKAISTGQVIEALYALDGEPAMVTGFYNTEDDTVATYEKSATLWADAYNILPEDFGMDSIITQAELAEVLYNYAKHHDVDVTANGQQNASDWVASYGFITADQDKEMGDETVTPSELASILSSYTETDLPKVGVVENGLSLIFPSAKQTQINPLCDFYVIGDIDPSITVPDNAQLAVQLRDSNGKLMRDVFTNIKDNTAGMYVDYPQLAVLGGDREAFRNSMMPDIVYDPAFPETFNYTWLKACYSDEHFTSVIYGGAYHDDIYPYDQYGQKLDPLPDGDYQLTVDLISGASVLGSLSVQITIGTVEEKVLSRFSPPSYVSRVREYASEHGYMVYEDPFPGTWSMPGFLPDWGMSYVGSIGRRWRLVDRMCYTGGMTHFFNYNTTATSTSYTMELGQLGYLRNLENPDRVTYVYWDIGEPEIKQQGKVYMGNFVEKNVSEIGTAVYTRIDHSMTETPENTINPTILNETTSIFDLSQRFTVNPGEIISLNGLCKVIQPEKVTLHEDGSLTLGNKIAAIRYTLVTGSGTLIQKVEKDVSLTRTFEDGSTSTSILEFRHNFNIDESLRNQDVRVFAQAIDEFGKDVGEQIFVCMFRVSRG